ncbi:hypothetical protein Lal_00018174 [Lupinus albus]|uniref:Putative nepenthesin n=1 Tax=Lupinus albus TaxID=3870 RepID=A0A6A5M1G0_LUPAL|nr:putative nepenthesin [Lupinus albus]KAF1866789.1 hypothetical protein Lal_00018174 [Lupinus albus]
MSCQILFDPTFILIFLFIFLLNFSTIEIVNGGFTVKLIRKNSLYAEHQNDIVQSPTYSDYAFTLMEVSIGTPPIKFYGVLDTGSDLIWLQCLPCPNCYKQKYPLFDPQKSSTYTPILCQEDECHKLVEENPSCSPNNECSYNFSYLDTSKAQGLLALDTITLNSTSQKPISLQSMIFGCGHNNTGFFSEEMMGIIGLGGGPLSLISQIGPSFGGKRFSYCLVPYDTNINISSHMSFGSGSEVLGDGVVTTSLVAIGESDPLLRVTLQGISVENTYFPLHSSSKGNMFFDSATTLTILPQPLYNSFVNEVRRRVSLDPVVDDPELNGRLCYRTSTSPKGPLITIHFENANVLLGPTQTFYLKKSGIFCLTLVGTDSEDVIYGYHSQTNYLIGIDFESKRVSFKETDCTKY